MIDLSDLVAEPMGKTRRRDFEAYRYYSTDGILIYKTCTKCGKVRSSSDFSKNSRTKDKLFNFCILCARDNADSWYNNNKDSVVYDAEKSKARGDLYRTKNRNRTTEEILEDQKRLRPDGTKKCSECGLVKYLSEYPTSLHRADGLRRMCRPCKNSITIATKQLKPVKYWKQNNIPLECYICGGDYEDAEHVVPKSLGGSNNMTNILPSCVECNRGSRGKWNNSLEEWLNGRTDLDTQDVLDRVVSYGVDPYPKI